MADPAPIAEHDLQSDVASPSGPWTLGLCAAVLHFLVDALPVLLTPLARALRAAARGAPLDAGDLILAMLPLLVIGAPALRIGATSGRRRLVTHSAALALAAGVLAAALVESRLRLPLVVLVVGAASVFLSASVGLANRRAVAAGFAGALGLRELARVAQLEPGGAGVTVGAGLAWSVLVAALGLWCLLRWRATPVEDRGESFERRAGGLRLRGALALGALLFLALLPIPHGVTRADVPAAFLIVAPLALAWLWVVRGVEVRRHRLLAVALAVFTMAAALVTLLADPAAGARAVLPAALGHASALLLLDRALAPVSGRRSGGNLAVGLLLFVALSLGFAGSIGFGAAAAGIDPALPGMVLPVPHVLGAAGWLLGAGIVLIVAMHLTPRPPRAPSALSLRFALPITLAMPLLAALLAGLRE